jgi:hypothetical protein
MRIRDYKNIPYFIISLISRTMPVVARIAIVISLGIFLLSVLALSLLTSPLWIAFVCINSPSVIALYLLAKYTSVMHFSISNTIIGV